MRLLTLNALTAGATLLILLLLSLPAKSVLERGQARRAAAEQPWRAPADRARRVFGVYADPWHVDDWARAVGAAPQAVGIFEAFARDRTIGHFAGEATRKGIRHLMVTWEPWATVPSALGVAQQSAPQPGYRNLDIARGAQDRYMIRFARELAHFPGTVYLRYAHEMNGYWYPWSRGAAAYRWSWQRMVRIVRAAGAHNVRFVWSVNPSLYEPERTWRRTLRRYWPGGRYVDLVGSTMIDFGGTKDYPVERFAPRLRALRRMFGKPLALTETNTDMSGRVEWLSGLRQMLTTMPWIRVVMWSQLPSRGKAQQRGTGIVDWDIQRDPAASAQLRMIVRDGR